MGDYKVLFSVRDAHFCDDGFIRFDGTPDSIYKWTYSSECKLCWVSTINHRRGILGQVEQEAYENYVAGLVVS